MILDVFLDFWTNQTMLKLTYCNLHHHLVLLKFMFFSCDAWELVGIYGD